MSVSAAPIAIGRPTIANRPRVRRSVFEREVMVHHPGRHCQRKVARTEFSTDDRELGRPELTPLGKRGGAVELEIVS